MAPLIMANFLITALFIVCYAYQFLYIPVPWMKKEKEQTKPTTLHDYAILICARNEAVVIADLIESLKQQTYPAERIHIFVMADNCTDETAQIAERCGATVYVRFNQTQIGKGYALDALLAHIRGDYPQGFDGYIVFDADNILAHDYIEQMNRTFCEGYEIITSYRNSKNYGDNWISAGYALWFLRESRYLNHARHLLGTSCAVSGTGFLFSRRVAEEIGGWPYHMLTEDIEFTIDQITRGRRIAFCSQAVLYDEQPTSFRQSFRQRMRWSRGFLQVFHGYWKKLLGGICKGHFSCFDLSMVILPAYFLSALSIINNLVLGIWCALLGDSIMLGVRSVAELFINIYGLLFVIGLITVLTEWKQIHTSSVRKILFLFTFPIFMFTYIPISFAALLCKTGWKPIAHTVTAKHIREKGFHIFDPE